MAPGDASPLPPLPQLPQPLPYPAPHLHDLEASQLYDPDGTLNLTAVLVVYESFSLDDQRLFLQLLNLDSSTDILGFFNVTRAQSSPPFDRPKLEDFYEYRLHKQILLYLPPVFIVVGVVGNLLSFVVLSRPAMRRVSAYLYLAVLSIADTLVLFVGLLRLWLAEITGYDVQDGSELTCKLISALGSAVSDCSVWLIIAVTAERFIAVCYPLRAPQLCGRSRALAVIVLMIASLLIINAHFFWTTRLLYGSGADSTTADAALNGAVYGVGSTSDGAAFHVSGAGGLLDGTTAGDVILLGGNTVGGRRIVGGAAVGRVRAEWGHCEAAPGYEDLVDKVWPWVDAFLYSFIPFATILVLNTLIIRKVIQSRRTRIILCSASSGASCQSSSGGGALTSSASEQSTRLSVMLLTVSCAFLVTTLPMNTILIATAFWKTQTSNNLALAARFKLHRTVTEMLMYANHSMNFFLYCTTGNKFRQELGAFLGWRRKGARGESRGAGEVAVDGRTPLMGRASYQWMGMRRVASHSMAHSPSVV